MKFRFITILHNMKLDSIKSKGIHIGHGARITNGLEKYSEIFKTHEMHETAENPVYFYIDDEFKDIETIEEMNKVGDEYTFHLLREAQRFTDCLWTVKDNNVYVAQGILVAYDKNIGDGSYYEKTLTAVYSYSTCEKKESLFTKDEIDSAINYYEPYIMYFDKYDGNGEKLNLSEIKDLKYPSSDLFYKNRGSERMSRADYFIKSARASAILPLKIVNYCIALECLFNTSKSDATHKIAERVAVLFGTSEDSKIDLFRFIKKAYDYRSTLIHGDSLRKFEEESKLATISERLDNIFRHLFTNNYKIFSKNNNEMDDDFLHLLFKD